MMPAGDPARRFVPVHPPRSEGPVSVWRGFVGERARTAVYGWSRRAFSDWYMGRTVVGHRVHIPLHPDMIQHVLLEYAGNYAKPDLVLKLLAPTIGQGLLSSDGALWREQRRIVAASFTPAAVDPARSAFEAAAELTMEGWTEGIRDVAAEATVTTMRIISDTLFGGDPRLTSSAAIAHIKAAMEGVTESRFQVLVGLPIVPWSRGGFAGRRGQIFLRRTLSQLVEERVQGSGPDDFLSGLIRQLQARFAPEQAFSLAVDNAATFYLAGHETTANALTWTLYLLSEQPDLQAAVSSEARSALAHGLADLDDRLPLLRRVLDESLRLYPPAPRFDRQAVAADRIGGHEVRPGDFVSIWPWLIHRHRKLWDDPDVFDPNRFSPENKTGRHRFQYIPFGGGPRVCVGARFATAEALTVLACWLSRWSFSPVPGREVRVSGMVTLRPAGGLPLRLRPAGN